MVMTAVMQIVATVKAAKEVAGVVVVVGVTVAALVEAEVMNVKQATYTDIPGR